MILPDVIVLWMAAGGLCALIFGARRAGLALVAPAVFRWIVWPAISPVAGAVVQDVVSAQSLPVVAALSVIALLAGGIVIVLGAIALLQLAVGLLFGRRVGDIVAAHYLLRVLAALSPARRRRSRRRRVRRG